MEKKGILLEYIWQNEISLVRLKLQYKIFAAKTGGQVSSNIYTMIRHKRGIPL